MLKRRTIIGVLTVILLAGSVWLWMNAQARVLTHPTPTPVPAPDQGENLALTAKSIRASGADGPEAQALCAKDKSYVTAWTTSSGADAWLEIDLGKLCRVSGMVIVHPSIWDGVTAEDLKDYEIAVRADSFAEWETVLSIHNNGNLPYNLETFPSPRDFRYARLTVNDPALGPGSAAKIQEWQIWGLPLEQSPGLPEPGPRAAEAQDTLATLMAHRNDYNWDGVITAANEIDENPDAEPDVWGRAMIELGLAQQEIGNSALALSTWQQVKEQCANGDLAGEAACKKGHFLLTQALLSDAAGELLWAMGNYPNEKCAVWARIDLIDYYGWSRKPDIARALVYEVSDLYPLQTTIGQKAWADWKGATIGDWEPDFDKEAQAVAFNNLWQNYKDAGGETPDEAAIQARDAAFLAKVRVIDYYYQSKEFAASATHAKQILGWWPDKKGGWAAGMRYRLADSYFRLKQYADAQEQLDILVQDFPDSEQVRIANNLRERIRSAIRHSSELTKRQGRGN